MNLQHELTAISIAIVFAMSAAIIVMYVGASIIIGALVFLTCVAGGFLFWELEKHKRR